MGTINGITAQNVEVLRLFFGHGSFLAEFISKDLFFLQKQSFKREIVCCGFFLELFSERQ